MVVPEVRSDRRTLRHGSAIESHIDCCITRYCGGPESNILWKNITFTNEEILCVVNPARSLSLALFC